MFFRHLNTDFLLNFNICNSHIFYIKFTLVLQQWKITEIRPLNLNILISISPLLESAMRFMLLLYVRNKTDDCLTYRGVHARGLFTSVLKTIKMLKMTFANVSEVYTEIRDIIKD